MESENPNSPGTPPEHPHGVDLPEGLPDDIRDRILSDPEPETLHFVIGEAQGNMDLLRNLLRRDELYRKRSSDTERLNTADRIELRLLEMAIQEAKDKLGDDLQP